jgi:methylenetetrahydrofolate--tRNA-(uracil-5-)-methyltransferase
MKNRAIIIGAGLAGSEAAWQIAQAGYKVDLYEMRPTTPTKAHKTSLCAELVCSNSFRGAALSNAVGLLKAELKIWNSLIMQAAIESEVPAGGCLAVDREKFSAYVDQKIKTHPNINLIQKEITEIPSDRPLIIATGPLTSKALSDAILKLTGESHLAFFDAISPILFAESLDYENCFRQSRYDKGGDDYLNIPLDKEQYYQFIDSINAAEKYTGNEEVEKDRLEELKPFEGCMPIEDMALRGKDVARFGPLKPVGLTNPRDSSKPYAVIQLRQEDKEAKTWNMVGMQTRMKRHEQDRIFKSIPALKNAEFVRYGSVHRNTFINSPKLLNSTLEFRNKPGLFFAGQVTGTEGYVESTAGGLLAGINLIRTIRQLPLLSMPITTAMGALFAYISDSERKDFQPMNISYGLMPSYLESKDPKKKIGKTERRENAAIAAMAISKEYLEMHNSELNDPIKLTSNNL